MLLMLMMLADDEKDENDDKEHRNCELLCLVYFIKSGEKSLHRSEEAMKATA